MHIYIETEVYAYVYIGIHINIYVQNIFCSIVPVKIDWYIYEKISTSAKTE